MGRRDRERKALIRAGLEVPHKVRAKALSWKYLWKPDVYDSAIYDQVWRSKEEATQAVFSAIRGWGWEPKVDSEDDYHDDELGCWSVVDVGMCCPHRNVRFVFSLADDDNCWKCTGADECYEGTCECGDYEVEGSSRVLERSNTD